MTRQNNSDNSAIAEGRNLWRSPLGLAITTALAAMATSGGSFAASPESVDNGEAETASVTNAQEAQVRSLDAIVVTAQKREQSINEVGLSINVASAEQLVNAGVTDISDLSRIVPGLTANKTLSNTPVLTLRGVGFNEFTLGASPAVSLYTDEVPVPFVPMTRGGMFDLDRVEVMKGPQGILFGQNSTGGAVNYIAARPTEDFEAGFDLSYGTYDSVNAGGYLSGKIGESLGARLAFRTLQSDDWQYNFTRNGGLGGQDLSMARLLLTLEPSDRARLLLNVNGWRDRSNAQGSQLIGFRLQNPTNVDRANAVLAQPLAPNDPEAANWGFDDDLRHDDSYLQVSLRADFDLSENLSLTSISSYDDYKEDSSFDRDGTVLSILDVERTEGSIKDFIQEIRLSYDSDRLNWIIGANYMDAEAKSDVRVGVDHATNTLVRFSPTVAIPFAESTTTISQEIKQYAAFANAEFSLSDTLTALVGARYTNTAIDFEGCSWGDAGISQIFTILSGVVSGTPTPPIPVGECVTLLPDAKPGLVVSSLDEDNVSWRVGLNYQPDAGKLFYGLVAQGYKSGSYPTLSGSRSLQFEPVTQESLLSYEAGFKLTLGSGRSTQLNGAVFYYQYDDKQVRGSVFDPIFNNLERLVNVPESHIAGAEIELITRPLDGLRVSASGTYLKAKIDEFTGLNEFGVVADFSGEAIPFTPEWQIAADAEYRFPVGQNLEAFVGGNATYNSSATSTLGSPSYARIPDFLLLDLRAGITSLDRRWEVSVFGRNVTDEFHWTNSFANQDVIVRFAAKPRTYGIRLAYYFF